jgi:16S rRNA (uracil1498-N3)-methyltransferase
MSRRRLYVPEDCISSGVASPSREQGHHLRHVLRLAPGDEIEIFDNTGRLYVGTFNATAGRVLICNLQPLEQPATAHPPVVLAAALIKATRFEWMLEKVTELGVDEVVPLETRFSEIRLPGQALARKMERWHRIVIQACEQSGRVSVPLVREPVAFADWLAAGENCSHFDRLLCYEKDGLHWNARDFPAGPTVVCIGPEGGWDLPEVEAARRSGYRIVSLGTHTLRAETAAITAIALIRHGRG